MEKKTKSAHPIIYLALTRSDDKQGKIKVV